MWRVKLQLPFANKPKQSQLNQSLQKLQAKFLITRHKGRNDSRSAWGRCGPLGLGGRLGHASFQRLVRAARVASGQSQSAAARVPAISSAQVPAGGQGSWRQTALKQPVQHRPRPPLQPARPGGKNAVAHDNSVLDMSPAAARTQPAGPLARVHQRLRRGKKTTQGEKCTVFSLVLFKPTALCRPYLNHS